MNSLRQQSTSIKSHFKVLLYTFTRTIATLPKPVTNVTHAITIQESLRNEYMFGHHPSSTGLLLDHGKGCYVYDTNNRAYLDFAAGPTTPLGHADPTVTADLHRQSQQLINTHITKSHTADVVRVAEMLVTKTNAHAQKKKPWAHKVVLCHSGAQANAIASTIARRWGKSVGGDKKTQVIYNKRLLHDINEQTTAAVLVEPVQRRHLDQSLLTTLRRKCNQTQSLLVYDEVQCGFGWTGKLWAHQQYDESCTPDMLTVGEALANGVSIGAIVMSKKVADTLEGGHESIITAYGGNPLLASGVVPGVMDRITNEPFLNNVVETGSALQRDLLALRDEYPDVIKTVHGHGLFMSVEFYKNPEPLVRLARERGLLLATTAPHHTIRITPPLILTKEEAREGIARFFGAMKAFI